MTAYAIQRAHPIVSRCRAAGRALPKSTGTRAKAVEKNNPPERRRPAFTDRFFR